MAVEKGNTYEYTSLAGEPDYKVKDFVDSLHGLFRDVRWVNNFDSRHKKVYLEQGRLRPGVQHAHCPRATPWPTSWR